MWFLGHDINLVWFILIFFGFWMVVYSGVIGLLEDHLHSSVLELFRYGKTLNGPVQSSLVGLITIPKGYFSHFYMFSSVYIPLLLLVTITSYLSSSPAPRTLVEGLDLVCTQDRTPSTSHSRILLALCLLTLQSWRRLYECLVVNQPTKSTMNLTHYIVGFAHYFCTATGYLCEAPSLTLTPSPAPLNSLLPSFTTLLLVLPFLYAWYQQLVAHQIFADLKRQSPTKHSIPEGGLFTLVSCPHYLCEIIIYTVLMLVLGTEHRTGVLVWIWVVVNQVIAALMSHSWYRRTFRDYPLERRAILPYLL